MANLHDISIPSSQALDIVEAGTDISQEQLERLLADEALQTEVDEWLDLRSALRVSAHPVDVEARLKQFKQTRTGTAPANGAAGSVAAEAPSTARVVTMARRLIAVVAAAAVLIGAVFLLRNVSPSAADEAAVQADAPLLFTADAQPAGLQLTNEQGQSVVLSPRTKQSTAVSLDDFRRVLSEATTERVTLSVPYGKSADISLPDGSVACLHPGSRLVFPTAFVGAERRVVLDGEAYFRVARDEQHPFIVVAGNVQTTVLGTEFNIDTRSNAVTLISGSVRVSSEGHELTMKPRQQCTWADGRWTTEEVDVQPYEMWRDGYLYFDQVELRDIMLAIGQNFNMSVEFRSEEAMHQKMRFIAERNNGVEAAIETMNRMKKVTVQQVGGKLVVW